MTLIGGEVYADPIVAGGRDVVVTRKPVESEKLCVASVAPPLATLKVREETPVELGLPDKVPVPLPLSWNVTPDGAPVSVMVGLASPASVVPDVLTVKVDVEKVGNAVVAAEVKAGELTRNGDENACVEGSLKSLL